MIKKISKCIVLLITFLLASCEGPLITLMPPPTSPSVEITYIDFYASFIFDDDENILVGNGSDLDFYSMTSVNNEISLSFPNSQLTHKFNIPELEIVEYEAKGNYTNFLKGEESITFLIKNSTKFYYKILSNSEVIEFNYVNRSQVDLSFPLKEYTDLTLLIYPYNNNYIYSSEYENISIHLYGKPTKILIKGEQL